MLEWRWRKAPKASRPAETCCDDEGVCNSLCRRADMELVMAALSTPASPDWAFVAASIEMLELERMAEARR